MRRACLPLVVIGLIAAAAIGTVAGRREVRARPDVSTRIRDDVSALRDRLAEVRRELAAAETPAAASAARAKLFQLRVDLVAVEDAVAGLGGQGSRSPVAHDR